MQFLYKNTTTQICYMFEYGYELKFTQPSSTTTTKPGKHLFWYGYWPYRTKVYKPDDHVDEYVSSSSSFKQ